MTDCRIKACLCTNCVVIPTNRCSQQWWCSVPGGKLLWSDSYRLTAPHSDRTQRRTPCLQYTGSLAGTYRLSSRSRLPTSRMYSRMSPSTPSIPYRPDTGQLSHVHP